MNPDNYQQLLAQLEPAGVTLVAVSKMQPAARIRELYELGQRDFGENYVQELVAKAAELPSDIRWHFIGHLQTNKVKQIVALTSLIQGVDSLRLLREIDKQAARIGLVADCLLQIHIAKEETKFGLDETELQEFLASGGYSKLSNIRIRGLMGMASFSEDQAGVKKEFTFLKKLSGQAQGKMGTNGDWILSMGMSGDFKLAMEAGSTMVRIGSLLFGARSPGV